MLEAIRRVAIVPEIPLPALVAGATLVSFLGLLIQGRIHPLMIYCLQLYLSF